MVVVLLFSTSTRSRGDRSDRGGRQRAGEGARTRAKQARMGHYGVVVCVYVCVCVCKCVCVWLCVYVCVCHMGCD